MKSHKVAKILTLIGAISIIMAQFLLLSLKLLNILTITWGLVLLPVIGIVGFMFFGMMMSILAACILAGRCDRLNEYKED